MIDWLCGVFGFARHAAYEEGQGGIAHADHAKPIHCRGRVSPNLARARAHGAEIVIGIKDEDCGGRGFSCRNLEGHFWNVGTYDAWKETS